MWVQLYVCEFVGGGVNVALKKKNTGSRIMIFSNQHWVCKFEEMGLDMFLR